MYDAIPIETTSPAGSGRVDWNEEWEFEDGRRILHQRILLYFFESFASIFLDRNQCLVTHHDIKQYFALEIIVLHPVADDINGCHSESLTSSFTVKL